MALFENFPWPTNQARVFSSIKEFSVVKRCGQGGYSQVYKVVHNSTGQKYALKHVDKL